MDEEFVKLRTRVVGRAIASVIAFCIFVIAATAWAITGHEMLRYTILVPLVAAVFVLPRKLPAQMKGSFDDDSPEMRETIRLGLWLSYVRFAYFAIAVFVMLGVPELLN